MTIGMVIEETMSGWLELDNDAAPRDFSFSIRAFTDRPLALTAPRDFRGRVRLDGVEAPVAGTLTIHPTGPAYELVFDHPELGTLYLSGRKTYDLRKLKVSMTTCPLKVYRDGKAIGSAEVAYRDSMLAFPFKAIRLARPADAFGRY